MRWMHPICNGDEDTDSIGIYNCQRCRKISDRMDDIERKLSLALETNKTLLNMIAHGNEETALLKDLINKWIPSHS